MTRANIIGATMIAIVLALLTGRRTGTVTMTKKSK
jgi:Asp/Glu/hydantoin racemase